MRLSPFKIRVIIMNLVFLMLFLGLRLMQQKGEAQCVPFKKVLCSWGGGVNFSGDTGKPDFVFDCQGGTLVGMYEN